MTYASDPPRLRALARALPSDLALALESAEHEEASFSELEQLALSVRSRAAFASSSDTARRQVSGRWHGTVVFQGTLGLVMLFALGATAGVLVVTGLWLGFRGSSPGPGPAARSSAGPAWNATPRRAPTPPATASARAIASQRVPSTARTGGSAATTDAPNATPRVDSGSEFSLVSRAQASLATDPVRALALVSDHERQFPNGALVEECELIAIDALLRLGRHPDAQARALKFKSRFPASVHQRRIEVLLGVPATGQSHRP